jgi:hypothetical protein
MEEEEAPKKRVGLATVDDFIMFCCLKLLLNNICIYNLLDKNTI